MPAYRRGDPRSDTPEPVVDEPQPARKPGRGKRQKLEPSANEPDTYYSSLAPDQAMAASAIIGPPGAHDAGGQAGLGTGVAN
jgi:hypothetical protein